MSAHHALRGVAVLGVTAALALSASAAPAASAASAGSADPTAVDSAAQTRTVTLSSGADLQSVVDAATPGTVINLGGGTYRGPIVIKTSGVTVQSAPGAARATITATLPPSPCNATSPAAARTIRVINGADNITIRNIDVIGGIYASGKGANDVIRWLTQSYATDNVADRRSAPGLGERDPVAARGLMSWYQQRFGADLDPSDHLVVSGVTMTKRGLFAGLVQDAEITNNSVSDQDCGIGSAIWVNASYFGTISGNDITDLAVSTWKHYMQEGIRMGGASAYNTVSDNDIHDIDGQARGVSTDYAASFNTITGNRISNVYNGLDDEQDGWGNAWTGNTISGTRNKGIVLGGLGAALFSTVNLDYTTVGAVVSDNVVTDADPGLFIGSVKDCTFTGNLVGSVAVDKDTRGWFGAQGNTWDGLPVAP